MMRSVMRRLCVLIFLAAVTAGPAFADSMFTLNVRAADLHHDP